jgi:nicotinamide mononucleotide adenylyltransferase
MVRGFLLDAGRSANDFNIVPFPIERPNVLNDYIPTNVLALTTVYEEWNQRKIELLRASGYEVETLWERDVKEFSGSTVRRLLRAHDNRWRDLVPPASSRVIDEIDVDLRLGPDSETAERDDSR